MDSQSTYYPLRLLQIKQVIYGTQHAEVYESEHHNTDSIQLISNELSSCRCKEFEQIQKFSQNIYKLSNA